MSDDKKLAKRLHEQFCMHNHIDGCSWEYEKWDGYTHLKYLDQAHRILGKFSLVQAIEFLDLLKG